MKSYIFNTGLFILILHLFNIVDGRGHVEVRLKSYLNSLSLNDKGVCCKNPSATTGCSLCDPYIQIFLEDNSHSGVNISRIITTDVYSSTTNIAFNASSGHFNNPFKLSFEELQTTMVLVFQVFDQDSGSTVTYNQLETVKYDKIGFGEPASFYSTPAFVSKELNGTAIYIQFEYRLQCDVHYYGANCKKFCSPKPGQYNCSSSATKICETGWSGTECDHMKLTNPCYNNTCQHNTTCLPGLNKTYTCICGPRFTGKHCETIQSTTPTTPLTTPSTLSTLVRLNNTRESNSTVSNELSFLDDVTKKTLFIAGCTVAGLLLLLVLPLTWLICRFYKNRKVGNMKTTADEPTVNKTIQNKTNY